MDYANTITSLIHSLVIPDLWQQDAVRALREGRDVVVHAPTGAGKTFIFELFVQELRGQAVFTVPTRALANDKLAEWRARGWDVGIATGDLALHLDAKVLVATLETHKGKFLQRSGPRLLVVDEYQMIADAVRGTNYELALAAALNLRLLCERQRRSIIQPRVARRALPWVSDAIRDPTPKGLNAR